MQNTLTPSVRLFPPVLMPALQPLSRTAIMPFADGTIQSFQPTFSNSRSALDFPQLENCWRRSSRRGSVYVTDENSVLRTHSWGPRLEDNFDESIFPDGYIVRRDRDGSTFECFPLGEEIQYFRLTRSDGQEFCWKSLLRQDAAMSIVDSIPLEELSKCQDRSLDIGLQFD
jgi:hypothetical protein